MDAVSSLAARLATMGEGGVLGDALDHLFGPTPARAGIAYLCKPELEVACERGLSSAIPGNRLREALAAMAKRAIDQLSPFSLADVRVECEGIALAGEIAQLGCTSSLSVPIVSRGLPVGALVLLFPPQAKQDPETIRFVVTVASIVAPALTPKPVRPPPAPNANLDQSASRQTGVAVLGPSVAHELEGPLSALALQLEEQRRLISELTVLSEDSDTVLGGTVAELAELTDEMGAVATRLRDTTDQLTQLGKRERVAEALDISELVRAVCAVMRPSFEQRGIHLVAQLTEAVYVSGHRESLLQVVSDLVALAGERAEHAPTTPRVVVRTQAEDRRVVLSVDDLGPALDGAGLRDLERRPFADVLPHERRRLVLKLLGDVVGAHGGHVELVPLEGVGTQYRVILPVFGSLRPSPGPIEMRPAVEDASVVRRVLVVDDDPVFTRAARRALRPHQVREAASASEAEIQLLDGSYVPDLIICDLMLPGADGTSLHRRVVDRRHEMGQRFLFVTGATLGKDTADYIRSTGCGALRKPLDLGAIRRNLSDPHRDPVTTSIVKTLRRDAPSD